MWVGHLPCMQRIPAIPYDPEPGRSGPNPFPKKAHQKHHNHGSATMNNNKIHFSGLRSHGNHDAPGPLGLLGPSQAPLGKQMQMFPCLEPLNTSGRGAPKIKACPHSATLATSPDRIQFALKGATSNFSHLLELSKDGGTGRRELHVEVPQTAATAVLPAGGMQVCKSGHWPRPRMDGW